MFKDCLNLNLINLNLSNNVIMPQGQRVNQDLFCLPLMATNAGCVSLSGT